MAPEASVTSYEKFREGRGLKLADGKRFREGHGFSRADNEQEKFGALAPVSTRNGKAARSAMSIVANLIARSN
jgi:hypothetical protein